MRSGMTNGSETPRLVKLKRMSRKKTLQLEQVNIFIYQVFPLLIKSQSQLSNPFILENEFSGAPVEMVETKCMMYLKLVIRHFFVKHDALTKSEYYFRSSAVY